MTYKVDYELKIDKIGRKYANKIDLKTNKRSRINYKTAQKRISSLKYERKVSKIKEKLKSTGSGATYKEYKKAFPVIEKEIKQKYIKEKRTLPTDAVIRSRAKRKAIEERTGMATRFRLGWVYWLSVQYTDPDTGKKFFDCDSTPIFIAAAEKRDGDYFKIMCDICDDEYNDMMRQDLCKKPEGGACVVRYNKFDKSIIGEPYELGDGCGFKLVFQKPEEYE